MLGYAVTFSPETIHVRIRANWWNLKLLDFYCFLPLLLLLLLLQFNTIQRFVF